MLGHFQPQRTQPSRNQITAIAANQRGRLRREAQHDFADVPGLLHIAIRFDHVLDRKNGLRQGVQPPLLEPLTHLCQRGLHEAPGLER